MIFQEPMTSLNPLHTIGRQVAEVLTLHMGLPKHRALIRAQELLELVALGETAKRLKAFPHELSGGQRQRVMIAMALACEPDLLIADEPTTALDVTVQAQILKLLGELQRRLGMAMLLITHDLSIVRHVADRVCVMRDGAIVEEGPCARIFEAPAHPYTQMLIAAEPKGEPLAVDGAAAEVVACDDLKIHFPIKAGVFRHTVGHVKAVDGVTLSIREGQTVGIVGESGSGKTTLALALLRLISSEGPITFEDSSIQGLTFKRMRPLRRRMQIVFSGPLRLPQPAHDRAPDHRGRAEAASARQWRRRGRSGRRGAGGGRARTRDAGPLPARVLWRPAPAHRDRPRARAEAPSVGARRADLCARHVSPGPDYRPPARRSRPGIASPISSSATT